MAVHKAFLCQIYLDMKDVFLLFVSDAPTSYSHFERERERERARERERERGGFFLKQTGGREGGDGRHPGGHRG